MIPRKRLDRPITALRVTPSVFAIWAAVRPAACCANSRLSRDRVQSVAMAAFLVVPRHELPPRGRTWLECCTGALILATRISKGQGIADFVPGTGSSAQKGARWSVVPRNRGCGGQAAVDLALRLYIEPHHPAFEAGLGRRIAREHERIVAGHHVVGRARELFERLVAFDHFGHVISDRKYAAGLHVRVEVRGICRQHDLAAPSVYAHALQTLGMAADMVDGDARHDLVFAIMKGNAAGKDLAHHRDHVVDLER